MFYFILFKIFMVIFVKVLDHIHPFLFLGSKNNLHEAIVNKTDGP